MGLKDSIRPLLPPTNRAFLNQAERLSNTIEQYASLTSKEQQELQSKLENRVELLVDHIQELEQDILHDRTQLEDIHRLLEGYAHQTKASLRYTNLEYATIHQFGGNIPPHVIRARRAKALRIPGIGFRKSVQHPGSSMPARPYLGLSDMDEKVILDLTERWLRNRIAQMRG